MTSHWLKSGLVISGMFLLLACGQPGGYSSDTPAAPGPGGQSTADAVEISNFAFSPNSLTVPAGTTVTWTNKDGITHTSTSDQAVWDSGGISPGQSFSVPFNTPGTFTYHCNIHPGMTATIIVQ